jgi:hypothetical protein
MMGKQAQGRHEAIRCLGMAEATTMWLFFSFVLLISILG